MHIYGKTNLLLKISILLTLFAPAIAMESQGNFSEKDFIASLTMADIRLHRAIGREDPKKVADAIERGANLNLRGDRGQTLLHQVAYSWNEMESDDLVAIVQLLLQHGADPELRTFKNGDSPLDFAVQSSLPRVCKLILTQNINLFGQTHEGKTSFANAIERLAEISNDSDGAKKHAKKYAKQLSICDALIAKQCANHHKLIIQFLCCLKHSKSEACALLYRNRNQLIKPYFLPQDPIAPLLAIKDSKGKSVFDIWPENKGLVFNHPSERVKKAALIIKKGNPWDLDTFFSTHYIDFNSPRKYQLALDDEAHTQIEGNASFALLKLACTNSNIFETLLKQGACPHAMHNECSILDTILKEIQKEIWLDSDEIVGCCGLLVAHGADITPQIFQMVHQTNNNLLANLLVFYSFIKGHKDEKPLFFWEHPNDPDASPRPIYQSGIDFLQKNLACLIHEDGAFSQFATYLTRAQQSPLKIRYLIARFYECFEQADSTLVYGSW